MPDRAGTGSVAWLGEKTQWLHVLGNDKNLSVRQAHGNFGSAWHSHLLYPKILNLNHRWEKSTLHMLMDYWLLLPTLQSWTLALKTVPEGLGKGLSLVDWSRTIRTKTHMAEKLICQAEIVVQGQEGDSLQAYHDDLKLEAESTDWSLCSRDVSGM